jgi:hypothetical protein
MIEKVEDGTRKVTDGRNAVFLTYKRTPRVRKPLRVDAAEVSVAVTAKGGARLTAFSEQGQELRLLLQPEILEAIFENEKDRQEMFSLEIGVDSREMILRKALNAAREDLCWMVGHEKLPPSRTIAETIYEIDEALKILSLSQPRPPLAVQREVDIEEEIVMTKTKRGITLEQNGITEEDGRIYEIVELVNSITFDIGQQLSEKKVRNLCRSKMWTVTIR